LQTKSPNTELNNSTTSTAKGKLLVSRQVSENQNANKNSASTSVAPKNGSTGSKKYQLPLQPSWFVDTYSWTQLDDEDDEVYSTFKFITPLIQAIETTDIASLAFFAKIIADSSKVFLHKLISNRRVAPHINKPIIKEAIRQRIVLLNQDLEQAGDWQLLDAKIPTNLNVINEFLQSNEKTLNYKNFFCVAEARAFYSKFEESFKKLGISGDTGGRQGGSTYLQLTKDHSKVIAWNNDKVREISKKIKSLELLLEQQ
jgi:hypothetical protein